MIDNTRRRKRVPEEAREAAKAFIRELVAQNLEVNIGILRPFIIHVLSNVSKMAGTDTYLRMRSSYYQENGLRYRWKRLNYSTGKLLMMPGSYHPFGMRSNKSSSFKLYILSLSTTFLAGLCWTWMRPLLAWYSSTGHDWLETGAVNVATQETNDKRQGTGTPWITAEEKIPFFHSTIKGRTRHYLPSAELKSRDKFKREEHHTTKLIFGYTETHWVPKHTMCVQIQKVEN